MKNIEIELRAKIAKKDFSKILAKLKKQGTLASKTKRLSVMFFGSISNNDYDIRVRITNGQCEVVVKKGAFHSHDRKEVSQEIKKEQFMGQVKIFNQFFSNIKVGERETFNFDFPGEILVSLVGAGDIFYLELEKMSSKKDAKKNTEILRSLANQLDLKLISSSEEYVKLCNNLTKTVDWRFFGKKKDYEKLEKSLKKY